MITWTAWEAPRRHQEAGRDHLDSMGGTREAPEAGKDRLDTREAGKDHLDSLGGTREAPGMQERTKWTACEAPGRQERTNWTACEAPGKQERTNWTAWKPPGGHQGGRKLPFGQPGRHQGDTREAGRDHLDSLGGTRDAPGRQERTNWIACEAPEAGTLMFLACGFSFCV